MISTLAGAPSSAGEALSPAPLDCIILALDFPSPDTAFAMLDRLGGQPRWVKVGLELYLAAGGTILPELKARGHRIFLDLKLHDIPNTVASAVRSLARFAPDMLTVHASGGSAMLAAAAEAAASLAKPPRLLAVTVLTSMDAQQLAATGIADAPADHVLRLGRLAAAAGVHGLIASPREAAALRAALPGVHLVTPGIREASDARGDQQRTATAAEALRAGANQIVVGRPITRAADPAAALSALLASLVSETNNAQTEG
jgi:orotidine-5'-phosphate decarboxylase